MRKIAKISAATVAIMLASAGAASADESSTDTLSVEVISTGSLTIAMTQTPTILAEVPASAGVIYESPMEITVTDLRGTGEGWNVYQGLDSLTYHGELPEGIMESPLDGSELSISRMDSLVDMGGALPGSYVSPANLPEGTNLNGGDLAVGQGLLNAAPGTGMGVFESTFTVALYTPTTILAGTYTGNLTTSVVSGSL